MTQEKKPQPKLSIVKAGAKKLSYIIASNPRDPAALEKGLLNYGVSCYNEGYGKKLLEVKVFKDIRLKRLNKAFNKDMDNIDNMIDKNKNKTNGSNN